MDQEAKSFRLLTISAEKLPDLMAQQEALTSYAAERARLLLGCYRTGDANDPETYVAAITATLAHFPEEVITRITHPVSGIIKDKTWLPSVHEVREACEREMIPIAHEAARQRRIAEQMAARAEQDTRPPAPTYAELKERYGENWGIEQPNAKPPSTFRAMTKEQLAEHYSKFKLGYQPKEGDQ